jgi:alanine dehydrogenase
VIALGMGAQVTVLERSVERMRFLEQILSGRVQLLMSSALQLEEAIKDADLTIGAVLIPGARAPKLVTREMLGTMKQSSVFVDVAIDQGGCAETSKPTTHDDPVYTVDGVIHYCVANMPGAVPITSTRALTNVTLPYVEELAELGTVGAVAANRSSPAASTPSPVGSRTRPSRTRTAWSTRRSTKRSPPASPDDHSTSRAGETPADSRHTISGWSPSGHSTSA